MVRKIPPKITAYKRAYPTDLSGKEIKIMIKRRLLIVLVSLLAVALCGALFTACGGPSSSVQDQQNYSVTLEALDDTGFTQSYTVKSDKPFTSGTDLKDYASGEFFDKYFNPTYGKHAEGLYLNGNKVAGADLILTEDITDRSTLVMNFFYDRFEVRLDAMGGELSEERLVYSAEYAHSMPELPVPAAPDGAEFAGWVTDTSVQVTDGDAEYLSDKDATLFCELYSELDPLSYGYTGLGRYWEKDGVICLYAAYKPAGEEQITSTITFDADGGSCPEETVTVVLGETFELPQAYRKDGSLSRWLYNDRLIVEHIATERNPWYFCGDITLKALYNSKPPIGVIFTADDFSDMRTGSAETEYVLASDIDLSDIEWVPFEFVSDLNGNGFTVTVSMESRTGDLAPFTAVSGKIYNITFEVNIESTSYSEVNVGGVCSVLKVGGELTDVTVSGKVTGNYCIVGGLVGRMDGGTITRAHSRCTVTGDQCFAGGIAGKQSGGTIAECRNDGAVSSGSYETEIACGGIAGFLDRGSVSDCENYGAVSARTACGGIAGRVRLGVDTNLNGVTNYADITGRNYVGGVVGYIPEVPQQFTLSGLTNEGDITGDACTGGVIGYLRCYVQVQDDNAYISTAANLSNTGTVTGGDDTGGIFGYFYGELYSNYLRRPSFVLNAVSLSNTGDVTGTARVGGLFGFGYTDNTASVIEEGISSGKITAQALAGGIAGKLESVRIVACSNSGTQIDASGYVTEGTEYLAYIGGYVGYGYEVSECINHTSIEYTSFGRKIGGIAGALSGNVFGCENFGNILAADSDYVGGIVGEIKFDGAFGINNLTNHGAVEGKTHVGGTIGAINCNYSGTAISTLRKISNDGIVTAVDYYGGLFGVINSRTLSASEFTFSGELNGVGASAGIHGAFGARVATQSDASSLTGWAWITDGVPADECSDGDLIGETEYFVIARE